MIQKFLYISLTCLMAISVVGCKTTKDVKVRAYAQDKERVDQDMEGNGGTIFGTPQLEDRNEYKETRKVYVLEFLKEMENQDPGDLDIVEPRNVQPKTFPKKTYPRTQTKIEARKIELPDFGDEDMYVESDVSSSNANGTNVQSSGSSTYVEYTVEKDDTLQKISKKFYDSFSKWPQIYKANKDVIENPDAIKPGTVIQIPMN